MKSFISYHLDGMRKNSSDGLGIIIFKPEYLKCEIKEFEKHCDQNNIRILKKKMIRLSRKTVIALYKNIFSFSKDDLLFGIQWKKETIKYLTSGQSICFLVSGKTIDKKLLNYKNDLRNRYGKITHPKNVLSMREFKEKVIKNLIHVVDSDELQYGLWLLFC